MERIGQNQYVPVFHAWHQFGVRPDIGLHIHCQPDTLPVGWCMCWPLQEWEQSLTNTSMGKVIETALIDCGFTYLGMCASCNGRAFDYQLDGVKAKIKVDQNMNEIVVLFNGINSNRDRIYNEVAVPYNIEQRLIELGLKTTHGNNTGN